MALQKEVAIGIALQSPKIKRFVRNRGGRQAEKAVVGSTKKMMRGPPGGRAHLK